MSGDCWPEQDVIHSWWRAHQEELKTAVSEYRIEVQQRETKMREALEAIINGVSRDSDVKPALNFCRQTAQRALGRAVDTEPIAFGKEDHE